MVAIGGLNNRFFVGVRTSLPLSWLHSKARTWIATSPVPRFAAESVVVSWPEARLTVTGAIVMDCAEPAAGNIATEAAARPPQKWHRVLKLLCDTLPPITGKLRHCG